LLYEVFEKEGEIQYLIVASELLPHTSFFLESKCEKHVLFYMPRSFFIIC
jgi:hypothetical protein